MSYVYVHEGIDEVLYSNHPFPSSLLKGFCLRLHAGHRTIVHELVNQKGPQAGPTVLRYDWLS